MAKRPGELLDALISSQRSALVRFLSRKLGSIDDAQEIAQDAFMRLHRLEHADDLDNARAYLFQVASNMAIDQLRRRKLHARYLEEEGARLQDDTAQQDPGTPEELVAARPACPTPRSPGTWGCRSAVWKNTSSKRSSPAGNP